MLNMIKMYDKQWINEQQIFLNASVEARYHYLWIYRYYFVYSYFPPALAK